MTEKKKSTYRRGFRAKNFKCKECGSPITKYRVVKHGMCISCYAKIVMKKWIEKNPERQKISYRRHNKKMKKMGFAKHSNYSMGAVCNNCGETFKGRFGKRGIIKVTHCTKCPNCGYIHSVGDTIEVKRVKRIDGPDNYYSLNNWELYKEIPDVKDFIASLPEKSDADRVEELRKKKGKLRNLKKYIKRRAGGAD